MASAKTERANKSFFMVLLHRTTYVLISAGGCRRLRQQRLDRSLPRGFVARADYLLTNAALAIDQVSCRQDRLLEFYLGITTTDQAFVFKLRDFLLVCIYTLGTVVE